MRDRALGLNGAILSGGFTVRALVGGALVSLLSWRPWRSPLWTRFGWVVRFADQADGALLGLNHAELFHLREDVDHPPGLSDSAVDEAENEDLVVRDGFAGRW
jgi:hypothetical protein